MSLNFFEYLPPEITINILSRLPVQTVVYCKSVCKPWLELVGTREFVESHLSNSVPALLVSEYSKLHRIFEFVDDLNLERHERHYNPVTSFRLHFRGKMHSSVNGLLFVRDARLRIDDLFICNPITCDYIKLNSPLEFLCSSEYLVDYGFGMSKITGEYKVVRISSKCNQGGIGVGQLKFSIPEWQVYTLGTGSWRRIIAPRYLNGDPLFLASRNSGQFLNGILHWLVYDLNGHLQISCFDIETEIFSGLPLPPPPPHQGSTTCRAAALCALEDSLCFCDSLSDAEIVIWSVKERGHEKFWVKLLVFCKIPSSYCWGLKSGLMFPLKVFKDGDVVFECVACCYPFYYSAKKKPGEFYSFNGWSKAIIYTPSFLSLKRFNNENVSTSCFNFCNFDD